MNFLGTGPRGIKKKVSTFHENYLFSNPSLKIRDRAIGKLNRLKINQRIVPIVLSPTMVDFMGLVSGMVPVQDHIQTEVAHGVSGTAAVASVSLGPVNDT